MGTNSNAPYGLKLDNQSPDSHVVTVMFDTSEGNIIGIGDAVKSAGSAGSIGKGPVVRTMTRVTAGDPIAGVIESFDEQLIEDSTQSLNRLYRPASTAMYAKMRVANQEDVYSIQADDVGGTLALADVSLNANLTGNNGGTTITDASTVTGYSTMELDTSTKNTTATLQLNIVGFVDQVGNYPTVANQKVLVVLNNIERSGGTGTVGIS